jgi:2-(1,2-epoxy-1,2-dihydrophenyl)acetyl-CoA isomerase
LILGGETVDGRQARELGLVQWTSPTEALADFAAALAQRVAAHPRDAIAANKRCIAIATAAAKSGFAAEIDETRLLYAAASTQERIAAFLDRPRRAASA